MAQWAQLGVVEVVDVMVVEFDFVGCGREHVDEVVGECGFV